MVESGLVPPQEPALHAHARILSAALVALALASWWWVPGLDWTGVDAAPLVQSARLDRDHALGRIWTQESREGAEAGSHFHRPLSSMSYAVDHAIWGARPAGYHLGDLALHLLATAALLGLARELSDRRSVAPWAAAALFATHPLHQETVPAIARRAEILAGTLVLLAAWGAVRARRQRRGGLLLMLSACLLAPLAKELGLLAPLVAVAGIALGGRRWLNLLWRWELAAALCVLPALLLRWNALGGLGGYAEAAPPSLRTLAAAAVDLLDPGRRLPAVAGFAVLLGVILLGLAVARRRPDARRPLGLALTLLLFPFLLFVLAGHLQPWYLYLPVAGWALGLGLLLDTLRPHRLGLAAVALAFLLPMSQAAWSGTPPQWRRMSDLGRSLREQLRPEASAVSRPMYVAFLPERVLPEPGHAGLQAVSGVRDYSLAAMWALEGRSQEVRALGYLRIEGDPDRVVGRLRREGERLELSVEGPARLIRPYHRDLSTEDAWIRTEGFRYRGSGAALEIRLEDPAAWVVSAFGEPRARDD